MHRIEYEPPLGPRRSDKIAPGDRARREQNRRRRESEHSDEPVGKREHENADKEGRDVQTQEPGHRVDLEV
jgi:hypothetical protein